MLDARQDRQIFLARGDDNKHVRHRKAKIDRGLPRRPATPACIIYKKHDRAGRTRRLGDQAPPQGLMIVGRRCPKLYPSERMACFEGGH